MQYEIVKHLQDNIYKVSFVIKAVTVGEREMFHDYGAQDIEAGGAYPAVISIADIQACDLASLAAKKLTITIGTGTPFTVTFTGPVSLASLVANINAAAGSVIASLNNNKLAITSASGITLTAQGAPLDESLALLHMEAGSYVAFTLDSNIVGLPDDFPLHGEFTGTGAEGKANSWASSVAEKIYNAMQALYQNVDRFSGITLVTITTP